MAGDFEEDKQAYRYSGRSYIKVFEDNLPSNLEPGLIFMHDSASIYTELIAISDRTIYNFADPKHISSISITPI